AQPLLSPGPQNPVSLRQCNRGASESSEDKVQSADRAEPASNVLPPGLRGHQPRSQGILGMARDLPAHPDITELKNQAKELQPGHKAGAAAALERIQASHPRFAGRSADEVKAARFTLRGALLVIAREYGFPTWPRLAEHIDDLALEKSDPDQALIRAIQDD